MNKESLLSENFTGYLKVPYAKGPVAVFENPSSSELREIINEKIEINNPYTIQAARRTGHIRFIVAIGKNKVYAFSAECLHKDVGEFVGYPTRLFSAKTLPMFLFSGEAVYEPESGKMKFFYSDNLTFQSKAFLERMSKMNWSFADKYFTEPVSNIIKKIVPKNNIYLSKKRLDDINKKLVGKLSKATKEKTKEAIDKVKGKVSDAYSSGLKHAEKKMRREVVKKIEGAVKKNGNNDIDDVINSINSLPRSEKMNGSKGNRAPIPRAISKSYIKNPHKPRKEPKKMPPKPAQKKGQDKKETP